GPQTLVDLLSTRRAFATRPCSGLLWWSLRELNPPRLSCKENLLPGGSPNWGGRWELNPREARVTVLCNVPTVTTATLVVHYLDEIWETLLPWSNHSVD